MTAATEDFKIEFIDARLMIIRNKLSSNIVVEIESNLQKRDVKYFIPRVEVKTFTYPQRLQDIQVRNSITGSDLSNRIVVAVVSNAAYNVRKTLTPLNFKHHNMVYVDITVDSKSVFAKPFAMNMANGQLMQPFWRTMGALGYQFRDDGCYISRNEFDNGYFMICADLSPTLCNWQYDDTVQSGIIFTVLY